MIRRSFLNIPKELSIFLYNIRKTPFGYCVPIWCPYLVRNVKVLEKVQKWGTKLVKGHEQLSNDQRLKSLGIYTLFCLHQHADLIEVFKILNGYYGINASQFLCYPMLPELEVTALSYLSHTPD